MDDWNKVKDGQIVNKQLPLPLDTPVYSDKVRFVCMSDTHSNAEAFRNQIPDGDVFLHCGDFTYTGKPDEVEKFSAFLGTLPHHYKIVIAGNHELTFDEQIFPATGSMKQNVHFSKAKLESFQEFLKNKNLTHTSELLKNCIFLHDSDTTVYGLRIYGSPWQPEFHDWAFNLPRGEKILEKWNKIPCNIDVLMTHGPPLGRSDCCVNHTRQGCFDLLNVVQQRVKPKFHVFGHIHEGRDSKLNEDEGYSSDGFTSYINASNVDVRYKPVYPPVIFDIPLPLGYTKF